MFNEEGWNKLMRVGATFGGLIAMYISANFSADGFSIRNPDLYWVGWLLALLIIIVEFIWRKPGMEDNLTMAVLGLGAYGYGIFTNVLGILEAMGITDHYTSDFPALMLALLTGLFLEVMPEPFVSWGFTGKSMADMFGETRRMINGEKPVMPKPHQQSYQREFDPGNQKQFGEFQPNINIQQGSNQRQPEKTLVQQHMENRQNGGGKPGGKTTFQGGQRPPQKRK